MEPHQEGASIGRPHFLTGENYSHWKVLDREGRSTNVVKPKLEWDRSENEASENNVRAMYSIFNAISKNEFCRIVTCTLVKEAWDILQMTHEETNVMKVSKLQMLTSRFLQTFEMTFASPRKVKGIALKGIKEESLSSKKKNTWSDFESNQSSEKESNGSKEYTNFIAFSTSVNEEPLLKKTSSELSEASDSNDENMSFDIAYDTLYKECLSLKQEQVKWKASKKILTNEVVLNGEKKALHDKIAFLENLHLEVKKNVMC
ncbi:hypothetical protein AAG906_007870 [Vitis piasezkii]